MSSEKEAFIRQFREIQPKFSRFFARVLTQAHLNLPQFALLSQLVNQKTMSMTEAGSKLHVTKPAITNLADRLEKNKFLKRLSHPHDRRIFLLQIQPKGEKLVRRTQTEALSFILKALHSLSAAERRTITRFYGLLSKAIDEFLGKPR